MTDTPRTDEMQTMARKWKRDDQSVNVDFARQLERELNEAQATIRQQQLIDEEIMRLRERVKHITDGFNREQNDIIQTCGNALGYPRFCDDQTAFPGATEADGVCVGEHVAASIAAELANKYRDAMERVKRLEKATP